MKTKPPKEKPALKLAVELKQMAPAKFRTLEKMVGGFVARGFQFGEQAAKGCQRLEVKHT